MIKIISGSNKFEDTSMPNLAQFMADLQGASRKEKALEVTPEMLAQIEKVAGVTLSASEITVFEAIALTTLPITKRGSMFHNAVVDRSTLDAMAHNLNEAIESIPMHTLHQQGGELPVGKVFYGSVENRADGEHQLRVLFYLPNTQKELIASIQSGILDEVSVGFVSKQSLCSHCSFDYQGPDATDIHRWDRTCPNGHTLGEDGVHLRIMGLTSWMELSLVSRGAAKNAKILGRHKETFDRLAASGVNPEAALLVASTLQQPEDTEMDPALKLMLEDLGTKLDAGTAQLTAMTAERDTAVANLTAVTAERDTAQTELTAAQARITELEAELAIANEAPKLTVADFVAALPAGGVSASADSTTETVSNRKTGAFKTQR